MVSAIASIEEQEDPNDTDPQDPNYDPNDDIENIEVTERKFDVKYAEDTGKSLSEAHNMTKDYSLNYKVST